VNDSRHKKRIMDVFNGQFPDRVPICEQAFASSVASAILGHEAITGSTDVHYFEACAWLQGEQAHDEFVEKCYSDTVELHKKLDLDILYLPWRMNARPTKRIDDNRILYGDPETNGWAVYKYDEHSRSYGFERGGEEDTFETVSRIMRDAIEAFDPSAPAAVDPLLLRAVREYGDEFEAAGSTGLAVPMSAGWLEATLLDRPLVDEYLEIMTAFQLKSIEEQSKAGIRLLNGGGDFAFNNGPVYSPDFFFHVMAPKWKKMFDKAHELGMRYIFRSDGNLWPVADGLFSPGLADAYYEVDYDAGMRFGKLRKTYPELVLFGNISCDFLVNAAPAQVRDRVLECLNAAYPRIVSGSANSILHGTPVDNVYALYDTAKNFIPPV